VHDEASVLGDVRVLEEAEVVSEGVHDAGDRYMVDIWRRFELVSMMK
jgi:hypothetical protein